MLLAVPNVSEGRPGDRLDELIAATRPARLLNVHSDPDHGRSVLTLAAPQGVIAGVLASLAATAARLIDVTSHPGIHPHVGALDVAPVVYLDDAARGAAVAEALTAGIKIGDEGVPVVLYGQLATRPANVERAEIRRGGPARLAERFAAGDLVADYGPERSLHPTAGATLVTARPPLIAFNVDLATADVELARSIAAGLRESGAGFPASALSASTCRRATVRRCRSTCTTTAPRRCATSPPRSRSARRSPKPSSSASRRPPRSRAFPPISACATSIPGFT